MRQPAASSGPPSFTTVPLPRTVEDGPTGLPPSIRALPIEPNHCSQGAITLPGLNAARARRLAESPPRRW